nr:RNA-directed DNA polymerase, eukaryota [Tanacetum cinerariifolium]
EICVSHKVNFLTLQKTKMEDISLIDVKYCWGNYAFDGVNLLIISVYDPQEYAKKKMLWDYLVHVISKWDGEVIVMRDFNEVRFKNERFGSFFHAHGADAFNRFILQADLQEIPLGGCSFTWCHRSAKKMSKLDRFTLGLLFSLFIGITIVGFQRNGSRDYSEISNRRRGLSLSPDQCNATDDILYKRMEIIKDIQEAEKVDNLEAAQKAKIKWR